MSHFSTDGFQVRPYDLPTRNTSAVAIKDFLWSDDTGLPVDAYGESEVYVKAEGGRVKIDVSLSDETVYLTQPLMADLFQTTKQNISLHIQSIFKEVELAPGRQAGALL